MREFVIGEDFVGTHPWEAECFDEAALRSRLAGDLRLGVGEIGLDRLKTREIPELQRAVFRRQLALAAEFARPVVLHGAKCWGEVVRECRDFAGRIPAFLFHGFSRSPGLLPDIAAVSGFVSVGQAILNDHAVNYRELAKAIPAELLLVETDRTHENSAECPSVTAVAAKLAELRGVSLATLEALVDANAERFLG